MKPEDELRRLRRFLVVSWALLLICLLVLTYWGSIQIRNLRSAVTYASAKTPMVIRGIDGKSGVNGQNGLTIIGPAGAPGANGRDGLSVTSDQISAAVVAYLQANPPMGEKGAQGNNGTDGLTQDFKVDYATCQLESKYTDLDNWTVIAQLPKPCDPNKDNSNVR